MGNFIQRAALAGLAAALSLGAAQAKDGKVALTFDDLPGATLSHDQAYIDDFNTRLLATLQRHHVPAIGFVIEGQLAEPDPQRQAAILRQWLDAGMDLGNHSYSHESPNTLGAEGYTADIARGEPITRALLAERGRPLLWFRHPYLETGSPAAVKHQIDNWLHAHGYRIAPVTMEASDWMFAEPYDDAVLRSDAAAQRQIRAQYLAYSAKMIRWYRSAARALFGREIAFVMLLHDTRINADSMPELLGLLRKARLRPVSLARAMRDRAYRTPDHYAGKDGIEWLERWSDTLHRELPWDDFSDPPASIKATYDKLSGGD